jgi:tRNA pseudouridine38-40 synthase
MAHLSEIGEQDGDARTAGLVRAGVELRLERRAVGEAGERIALDRAALDACAAACVGQHDFTAFTPTDTQHVFFHRTVLDCHWREDGDHGDELVLRIEANAFLRHMVRVLVGTMLECGRGRRTVEEFKALLEGAPRSAAGPTALPHALTLVAVRYR